MSIPKEPRQLMINIMYLVLTALLALNVSAEIFNAFKVVDEGLKDSTTAYKDANRPMPEQIRTSAKAKPEFQKYADRIDSVTMLGNDFEAHVQEMIDFMIDDAGDRNGSVDDGDYEDLFGIIELKGKKNYDVTTRYLVGDAQNPGVGEDLKAMITDYKNAFASLADPADRNTVLTELPMDVDDESWQAGKKAKKSWSEFNFSHMPLQATLPILDKFVNDARASEGAMLNYLLGKTGNTKEVILDKFVVISAPSKAYIIKGEKFETELSLGASASDKSGTKVSITVNGAAQSVRDGVAKWSQSTSSTGVKKYTVVATVKNPVTDEIDRYPKTFEYEVGERSANVSADKMNVFYIGVPNPISVTAAGISSNDLKVNGSGGGISLTKSGKGKYNANVSTVGNSTITLSGGGLTATKFEFRTKRIPDPVALLGVKGSGSMGTGEFKVQQIIQAKLENFDFEAKCNIAGFRLVRVAKRADPQFAENPGGRITGEAAKLISSAKPGDRYYFENVRAKCPGDKGPTRKINELIYTIK